MDCRGMESKSKQRTDFYYDAKSVRQLIEDPKAFAREILQAWALTCEVTFYLDEKQVDKKLHWVLDHEVEEDERGVPHVVAVWQKEAAEYVYDRAEGGCLPNVMPDGSELKCPATFEELIDTLVQVNPHWMLEEHKNRGDARLEPNRTVNYQVNREEYTQIMAWLKEHYQSDNSNDEKQLDLE